MWNLVLSGLSGILLGVFFSMDRSFPVGLYEEKLLERVIRVEVLLKDTMEKITETNFRIKEDRIKLNEAIHAQLEVNKQEMNSIITALDLERVIRVEVLLKNTMEKITETNVRIKEDRIKLNEAIHAQLEVNKQAMNSIITALDLSFLDKVESFIVAATENITATFEKMNSSIASRNEGQSVMHQVMFQVRRPGIPDSDSDEDGITYKYGINETIVFEHAQGNYVVGYDRNTGHFVAPEAGLYMFTLQYWSSRGISDSIQLVKEGRVLPKTRQMNGAFCLSVRAFAMLALGDNVWVKSTSEDDVHVNDFECMHSFSGMIVRL